jgi:beta-glucosidase
MAFGLALGGIAIATQATAADSASNAVSTSLRNSSLPTEQRVRDLISKMTLQEKAGQLGHTAPAIPRLGVPEYNWWNEGLHGVARAGIATVFPQAIGMAASWDVPLMHEAADVISTEFRAKYAATVQPDGGSEWYKGLTAWSPNINIFRDPRWGRGQETYGEDPYLTSRIGVAFVTGLQGDDSTYLKVVATPKHFAVHSGPEATRHSANVTVSRHDLEDTYLAAFRATVMEARAQSVMCAYNGVNGQPACANDTLLGEHLRKDWGFQGYVVSDCGAAADIFIEDGLHYAPNAEAGVTAAFKAGMDLICGDYRRNMSTDPEAIVSAVRRGLMPESVLDQALARLFTTRIKLGMFDPPAGNPYARIPGSANDTTEHRDVALRMAKASLVLLKNRDNLLPLKRAPRSIAVIGPNADSLDALVGNYNGTPSHPVTILAGIRQRFPQSKVTYVQGTGLVGPVTAAVPETALCVDAACTSHGLKAEYFANLTLTGAAAKSRVDRTIDFVVSPNHAPPLAPGYSVRWSGILKAPESGEYRIGFTGDDGYRVWVDGKLVTEDWTDHEPATTQTPKIQLQAGHAYALRIEYFQKSPIGEARFIWSLPSARGDDAVEAARNADLVVMVAGLSPRIEGEEMKVDATGFAGGDRTSLDLPAPQQGLLERVHAVGKPVILVLMNGSALGVNWADQNVPAIVEAWYAGGEGGSAVAALLAGDFSPAGRLPVTFYKSVDQLPPFDDYSMSKRTYRYFAGEPLYPFGYGLSFTKFDYANVRTSKAKVGPSDAVTVSVDVTNSGAMDGDEVVQLYLSHRGVAGAPIRALQGFQRIHLCKGEKKTVEFTLRDRALSIVDPEGKRRIVPGEVDVWVGGGEPVRRAGLARAAGVQTRFALTGEMMLPD